MNEELQSPTCGFVDNASRPDRRGTRAGNASLLPGFDDSINEGVNIYISPLIEPVDRNWAPEYLKFEKCFDHCVKRQVRRKRRILITSLTKRMRRPQNGNNLKESEYVR